MANNKIPNLLLFRSGGKNNDYTTIENGKVVDEQKSTKQKNTGFSVSDPVSTHIVTSDVEEDSTLTGAVAPSSDSKPKSKQKEKKTFDFKTASAKEAEKDAAERRVKEITIKSALSDEGIKKAKEHQQKIEAEKKKAQKQEQQAKVASLRASIPVNTQTKSAQENAASVQEWLRERQEKREKEEQARQLKENAARVIPKNANYGDVIEIINQYENDEDMLKGIRSYLADELEANRKAYHKFGDDNVYFIDAEKDILEGNVPETYKKIYDFDAFRIAHDNHKKSLLKYTYVNDILQEKEKQKLNTYDKGVFSDEDIRFMRDQAERNIEPAKVIEASTKPRSDVAYADFLRRQKGESAVDEALHDSYKNTMYREAYGSEAISKEIIEAADYYDKNKDNKYKDDLFGRIVANYRAGETSVRSNDAGYTSMRYRSDNIAANDIYDALLERLYKNNIDAYTNNTGFQEFVSSNAAYAPQFLHQLSAHVKGRVVGGTAGAAGGFFVGGPSMAVTAAMRASELGAAYESAKFMYRQSAGASYVDALRRTGNTEVAYEMAHNVAFANASIEFAMEWATNALFAGAGLLKKPFAKVLGESGEALSKYLAKKGISETAQRNFGKVVRFVANGIFNSFTESTEEYLQEGVSIQSEYALRDGENVGVKDLLLRTLNDEFESVDDYARMGEAKKAALMLSFFGGAVKLAGTGRDVYVDTKTRKALDTVQAFDYMAGNARMEFDDLSPAAQKLVKQEFADRPQELQTLIQQRSPTGTIAKEAQAAVDDMLSPLKKGKKKVEDRRFEHAKGIFDKNAGTASSFASKDEIDDYVDYAYKYAAHADTDEPIRKQKDRISFAAVSKQDADYIKGVSGVDISNMTHVITDNDVRHIKNSHGEKTNEKYPVTAEDIKKIPSIIKNYDDILYVKRTDNKHGIVYVKRHNGVTYYLEAIRGDENALINKQMIKVSTGTIPDLPGLDDAIEKKWGKYSIPNDNANSVIPRMYVQDVQKTSPLEPILTQDVQVVNTGSSPKTDNAPAGVEDFDVKANSEVSQELQKQLDDHVFNVQSDGSVRTLAQEKAERAEEAQTNATPALDKQLTDNPDVAAIVQDSNVKRAEDITFAHTQKLQGKSSMLFKDLPRVLDYACGKVPGLREFWRNRVEVPFALAKASFTSRTRNVLTEYKSAVDKLGIRMGSKESAAAQYYGEGYRTEWVKNPEYKKGTDIPKYVEQRHTYTLADLKREFPNTWGNIVKLDEINRAMYDKYLVELNTMLEKVYPDVEVRIQNEILEHQRAVQYLRENPERVRMEIATLEQDISSIERNLEDFKRRRASGEDISATLDALEQRRASKQSELDALKNKGTKKAAHIQVQAAKASDKSAQLHAENAERLDALIKRETTRLENKKAELAQKRNEISDAAQLRDAQSLSNHLSEIQRLKIGLESGELLRGKRVLARSDYYHHFQEMATGFKGLANILFTSDEIDPRLVGVSENTQPKSKWAGFMQRQGFGPYKADAIGGMLDYMQAAEYKIAFDPIIADMRSVIKTIAEDTSETRNANGLILYLTRWTDGLAGKTSFLDRPLQEITQRKLTKALSWLNSRAKSNTILGSFRNAFAQFMNLPNGFLYVQDWHSWGSGVANAIATINKNSKAKSTISQSAFLGERYMDDLVGSFKERKFREIIKTPKKLALAMMSAGDKFSANIIWNAAYAQGKRNGLSDADLIMYADDITRRAVAGRGVGELPPGLESKWVNLLAPFQVEVNNTWNALVATYRGKEAKTIGQRIGGLVMFEAMSLGLNAVTEAFGIGSMLPSMIGMLWDAVKVWMDDDEDDSEDDANGANEEEGVSTGEKVLKTGSLALNEMLSYMPFVSSLLPVLFDVETIEQFLGADNEITRYDSGNLGVSGIGSAVAKGVQGDWKGGLMDFASGYVMSWGGSQVKKLYEGFRDFDVFGNRGISASYTDDGNLRFPMERTPWNITKGMLLGKYATNEGMKYIDEGRKPMSDEQTGLFEYFVHHGEDPQKIYDYMNEVLSIDGERKSERQRQAIMDMALTAEQKSIFDKGMLGERKNPVDYTSKESFFDTAYDKKRKSTYYLMDAGLSESKAESIINALSKIVGDKDETGNTIEYTKRNKRVKWIYNNKSLTDAQKAILYREYVINDGSTYKPYVLASALGFDDEMLAKYFPYFMVVEPDFYANGKTVSKSKNKNVRRLANELGLSQSQKDLVYYYFYSNTKEKDAAEAKLLNKLYKKLTPEQRKDFDAWYKDNDKRVDEKALLKVLEGLK